MSNGTGLICSSVKENLAAAEKTRHDQQQQLAHKKAELARKTKTRKELKDATADAIENADIAEQKAQESTATKEKLVSDHQRLVKRKNDSETKMIENEATLRERKLAHSTLQQQHAIDLEGSITEHVQARQALESWLVNALAASSHDGLRGGVRRASKEKAQAAPSLVELNSALQLVTQIARLEAEIAKSRGTAQSALGDIASAEEYALSIEDAIRNTLEARAGGGGGDAATLSTEEDDGADAGAGEGADAASRMTDDYDGADAPGAME